MLLQLRLVQKREHQMIDSLAWSCMITKEYCQMPAPLGTSKQISLRGCTDELQNLLPTLVGMWLSTWRVPGECPEGRWTSLVADS